jgi:hypothetical protein
MANVTGTKCISRVLTASGGREEFAETAAPFEGCPAMQQSMGHLASSSPAENAAFDSDAAAAWWWCWCTGRSQWVAGIAWQDAAFPVPVQAAAIMGEAMDKIRETTVEMDKNRRMLQTQYTFIFAAKAMRFRVAEH